jgi:O-antigen/teichoic acid export membrane protein
MTRNFALTATSVGSRLLVSTLLFLLLARIWGPEDFGTFSFVFSVSALLMLTVDFGFGTFLLREIAADSAKAPELIGQGLRVKFLLTAVMSAAAAALVVALGSHALPLTLYFLLLLAALLLSFAEYFIASLRAFGRYDLEALLATTGNAAQFLLAGSTAWLGGTPVAVAGAMVVSRIVYLVASWRTLARTVPLLRTRQVPGNVRSTLQQLWPYGVDGALTSVWSFIDVITVRLLFGTQAVGLYAAGQKIVQGVGALAPVVGNVMIPQLARKAHIRAPDTWRVAALTGSLMVGIGFIFAIPLVAFPGWVTSVLFGSEFSRLADWLPWFGAILLVRYAAAGVGVILSAIGLQTKRLVGQVLAILVYALCTSVVAINGWGVEAALAALFIAMAVMGMTYTLYLQLARRRNYVGLPGHVIKARRLRNRLDLARLARGQISPPEKKEDS